MDVTGEDDKECDDGTEMDIEWYGSAVWFKEVMNRNVVEQGELIDGSWYTVGMASVR